MNRHRVVLRWILAWTALSLVACNTPAPGPRLAELPELAQSEAITLKFRSKTNPSPLKHHPVVSLDGQTIAILKESDRARFFIAPGTHTLDVTCHSRDTSTSGGFPINYNVADGEATMEINGVAGDTVCIDLGFKLLSCATLEDADPSFCK